VLRSFSLPVAAGHLVFRELLAMEVIVDPQGFWKPSNVIVLKEVAILRADALTPIVYQFAPPTQKLVE